MLGKKPVILAALLLLILSSCEKTERNVLVITDNIRIDRETEIEQLASSGIGDLLFSPLLYVDEDLEPHNVLAEEIRVLPGNRVIELKLREDIKLHGGKELTANDMVSAVDKLKEFDTLYGELYKKMKVKAIDRSTLRLTNDVAVPDINRFLANIYALPLSLSERHTGTGPFRFNKWLNNGVELVANDDYFEGRPKIDKIVYMSEENELKRVHKLLDGGADMLFVLSPEIAAFLNKDDRFYVKELSSDYYTALFFNTESLLLRDKAVRKAVSMSIDRKILVEKILKGGGRTVSAPFPPGLLSSNTETYSQEYHPKDAVRLLNGAGWRDMDRDGRLEKEGKRLKLRLYYDKGTDELIPLVVIIERFLFEAGIETEITPVGYFEFKAKHLRSGDYDIFLGGNNNNDNANFITWHSPSSDNPENINFSRYSNRDADGLLEELRETSDLESRKRIYGSMQQIFEEDVPAAFLYNALFFTAVNKKFKGAEDFVGNVYSIYKIKDWSLNEDYR